MKRISVPYKIKALLQKEINSKCPFCNSDDVAHFEVHHIDGNPVNNDLMNLILICPTCHSKMEKGDIITARVKEVKVKITKTKIDLSSIELSELENTKFQREKKKSEYFKSDKVKNDLKYEWNLLTKIFLDKCDEIKKNVYLKSSFTNDGDLKVSLNRIYILVQFSPQFEEYHLSCTFNFCDHVSLSKFNIRNQFIVKKYLFDMGDNENLGWNDGQIFLTSEQVAEDLLKHLIEINNSEI